MKQETKEKLPIIIGIALPIIFIISMVVVVYVPKLFINPQYDFVYTMQTSYQYDQEYMYELRDGEIVKNYPTPQPENEAMYDRYPKTTPVLYVYDVQSHTSRQISFDQAQDLILDPGPASPDNYTVQYDRGNYSLFSEIFSSRRDSGYVISRGNMNKSLDGIVSDRDYYYNSFTFLGWIIK